MATVHKLSYTDKQAAQSDLKAKGVLLENEGELIFAPQTYAVVYLGNIELKKAEIDADGNITKDAVFSPRYHVDIMTEAQIDFGEAEEIIEQGQPVYHTF